jgi:hypothetical protein
VTINQVHAALTQHPDGLTIPELLDATGLGDGQLAHVLHAGFHRQVLTSVNDRIFALPITEETP